jgi:hypothetical protein
VAARYRACRPATLWLPYRGKWLIAYRDARDLREIIWSAAAASGNERSVLIEEIGLIFHDDISNNQLRACLLRDLAGTLSGTRQGSRNRLHVRVGQVRNLFFGRTLTHRFAPSSISFQAVPLLSIHCQ